jgi:hypothetical protein
MLFESVDDLKQENQQHFLDDGFLADLKLWQWARAYCGSDDPDRINKALSEAGTAAKSRKVGANANGEAAPAARGRKKKATSAEAESPANEEILIDPALDVSLHTSVKGKSDFGNRAERQTHQNPVQAQRPT